MKKKLVLFRSSVWVARERKILVSLREMGDKKLEIDFLQFLSNFGQIFTLFDDFLNYNKYVRSFGDRFTDVYLHFLEL